MRGQTALTIPLRQALPSFGPAIFLSLSSGNYYRNNTVSSVRREARNPFAFFSSLTRRRPNDKDSSTKLVTDLIKRLSQISTATLCDADKSVLSDRLDPTKPMLATYCGLGLMTTTIRPRNFGKESKLMVGIARTVQCTRPNDFLAVLRGLDEARNGEVLLVNTLDSTRAVGGGLFATEAERKGLRGLVVDGPMRDTRTLKNCDVLCYSTSVTPYAGTVQSPGEMQTPITCGGIRVNPGDIVVGDGDGIVVGSVETFMHLIDTAENVDLYENQLMSGMSQGISLHSMSNYKEHLESRMAGKDSALDFRKKRLVSFEGVKPLHYE